MESRAIEKGPLLQPRQTSHSLNIIILAAGLGTRMKSGRAKVLHELDGRPLITYVCRTAQLLAPEKIYVVVGHQAAEVERALQTDIDHKAEFVTQAKQCGTGDAVMAARGQLEDSDTLVLVLSGDVPLIRAATLESLIDQHRASGAACSILSVRLENPSGYGRIIRNENEQFIRIVEQKDATPEEQRVKEINS